MGRDSAQETWRKTRAHFTPGQHGRRQCCRRSPSAIAVLPVPRQVEQALTEVFRAENRLRYIMGLSMSDGRLIRPSDEPTTARVAFDWTGIHMRGADRGAWKFAGRSGKSSGASWN